MTIAASLEVSEQQSSLETLATSFSFHHYCFSLLDTGVFSNQHKRISVWEEQEAEPTVQAESALFVWDSLISLCSRKVEYPCLGFGKTTIGVGENVD